METKAYAGKVHAVYRADEKAGESRTVVEGTVIAMFDTRRGAEKYIEKRKTQDGYRDEHNVYSIVPWLVQS
jgi:hypothetical protein